MNDIAWMERYWKEVIEVSTRKHGIKGSVSLWYDNQPPVLYLVIRLQSKDLQHFILIPVNPNYSVSMYYNYSGFGLPTQTTSTTQIVFFFKQKQIFLQIFYFFCKTKMISQVDSTNFYT